MYDDFLQVVRNVRTPIQLTRRPSMALMQSMYCVRLPKYDSNVGSIVASTSAFENCRSMIGNVLKPV